MGDKDNKRDDEEEKNDDTDEKKNLHQDRISTDCIRPLFPNFTRNCPNPSFKKYLQRMPHNLKALLPPQIRSKKRKRRSSKTDESDRFINCVKTYRQKLNEEILSQKQFISNGGLENLGGKSSHEMITINQSKFMLVPFFLVFKLELYQDLHFLDLHRCIPMSCTALMFSI